MATINEQKRSKRRLLATIAGRSHAANCEILGPMLQREKQRFVYSHDVQSATLFDIWNKKLGNEEATRLWSTCQQMPRVARTLDRASVVPIKWHLKPRGTAGFRKLCALPTTLKMWHKMAKDLIEAQHRPKAHIGDWRGRGRDLQIKEIAATITSNDQAVVVADVCRAFPNVNIEAVYELNYLPEAIIRRAIDYRSLRFSGGWRGSCAWDQSRVACDNLEMAPAGLLEGSPVSNALFSVLLDDLPDHLDEDIQSFVYCDNVILVAPNELRAQSAANALVRYFTGHRAGPFEVVLDIHSARNGFDHLGYTIVRTDTETKISLSPKSWEKLMVRLNDRAKPLSETQVWLNASYSALPEQEASIWSQIVNEEGHKPDDTNIGPRQ